MLNVAAGPVDVRAHRRVSGRSSDDADALTPVATRRLDTLAQLLLMLRQRVQVRRASVLRILDGNVRSTSLMRLRDDELDVVDQLRSPGTSTRARRARSSA